jgi:nucleotide-binding universal stress UspA family protein
MRVVVGTDFSPSARQAADLAATLATRIHAGGRAGDPPRLVLVHALEVPGDGAEDAARARLLAEAAKLRAGGATVEPELVEAPAAPALLAAVERHRAALIVVGVVGHRAPGRWVLGSTTDQVAQTSPVPVLGLRYDEAFHPWLHGEEPLRILYADDGSAAADAALAWADRLTAIGPLAITAARILPARERPWWPFRPPAPRRADAERDLAQRTARLSAAARVEVVVHRSRRPVAQELLELAAEARVGLILAGAQQRTGLRRLWTSSVSRTLLAGSLVSVLMVPAAAAEARPGAGEAAPGPQPAGPEAAPAE